MCTDLLARGVDFGRVNLVIHLQKPRTLATYLHRVGRTGRFGSLGLSVALLHKREVRLRPRLRLRLRPRRRVRVTVWLEAPSRSCTSER